MGSKGIVISFKSKKRNPQVVLIIGAVFGAGFDMNRIDRIQKGVNLQYGKRFILEKDERAKLHHGQRGKVAFVINNNVFEL